MKLQPNDWTPLADIKAVRIRREKLRSPRPSDSARAGHRNAAGGAGAPSSIIAPPALARSVVSNAAGPALAIALCAGWLAAAYSGQAQRGLLAGTVVALALLLPTDGRALSAAEPGLALGFVVTLALLYPVLQIVLQPPPPTFDDNLRASRARLGL